MFVMLNEFYFGPAFAPFRPLLAASAAFLTNAPEDSHAGLQVAQRDVCD
jgi:hypothetical protein